MKINNFLYLALLLIICSCGEDFLEPQPISAVSGATYYSSDEELEQGVVNIYAGIKGINQLADSDSDKNHSIQIEYLLTEMRSDNTRTKSSEGEAAQFENYSIVSTNGVVFDYYRSFYNIIYRANVVLANLDAATDANRDRFEGEAKFTRAYAYLNLVRLFGDIPLIDRVIEPTEQEPQFTRVPTGQIYEFIISDLQFAVNSLDNGSVNRASKAAAQALLAKTYLTVGINYEEARTLCEAVMASGFQLEPNFKDVFFNENNSETIFAIGYRPDDSNNSQNISTEWLNGVGRTAGLNYVTADARAILDEKGGNRTPFSYRVDAGQPTQFQVVKYLPDGDASLGIEPTSSNPRLAGNDWIILRLSDVLLMHVEAIMGTGTETSNPQALASFQRVRDRAGLTETVTNITKEELLDERRVELAFENHRFFDLIRFNKAIEVLSAFSTANGYSFSASDLLLPIPQAEINLGGGLLSQNPGY